MRAVKERHDETRHPKTGGCSPALSPSASQKLLWQWNEGRPGMSGISLPIDTEDPHFDETVVEETQEREESDVMVPVPVPVEERQVNLDEVWRRLGTFGRYQLGQAALLMLTIVPETIQLLIVVFIGFRPPYRCGDVSSTQIISNTSKYTYASIDISYHSCHVDLMINATNTSLLSISPCPAGYHYDLEKDQTFVTEYDLVCDGAERAELSQTLLIVGQVIGGAILPQCSDRFGRKLILVSSQIGLLAAGLGACFFPTFTGFAIMRFLIGVFQQGIAMARPAMMLELFPMEVRYLSEVAALFSWTSSAVLMTPVVYLLRDISWRYIYFVLTLTSAFSVLGYWLYDESIRWLLANGKTAKARVILRKAAKKNNVGEEKILQIVDEALTAKPERVEEDNIGQENERIPEILLRNEDKRPSSNVLPKYTIVSLFKRRRITLITLIMISAWTVDSLTYYGLILSSASLPVDRYLSFLLLAVAEYPVVFFEYILMNRLGRKYFCIIFHAVATVSLIAGTIANYYSDLPGAKIGIMIFFFLGKLGITGSFSCLFLYTPEIYPTNLRTIGIGLPSAAGRVGGMLAPFAGPLAARIEWAPGAIFSFLCVVVMLMLPLLPETKGHELPTRIEDLEEWYKAHSGTKWRQ